MSGRRTRSTQSSNSRINDAQIIDLTTKLQALLPEIRDRNTDKVSASKILQDICNYIRNLHREVDDLSEKLSEFLASADSSGSDQTGVIRSLLMQED